MPTADRVQRVAIALEKAAAGAPGADQVCLLLAPVVLEFIDEMQAYPEFITWLEARRR